MRYTPLEDKIIGLAAPVIEDLGFALHHIKITGESGASLVQIMAEDTKTRNLGVDDAAKISRAISAVMDVEDPINGAYRLEISSPGIDRLLFTADEYRDYVGFTVKIETLLPTESGQKKFRGDIKAVTDEVVTITTEQDDADIILSSIARAKLVLTDELIKETSKRHQANTQNNTDIQN